MKSAGDAEADPDASFQGTSPAFRAPPQGVKPAGDEEAELNPSFQGTSPGDVKPAADVEAELDPRFQGTSPADVKPAGDSETRLRQVLLAIVAPAGENDTFDLEHGLADPSRLVNGTSAP